MIWVPWDFKMNLTFSEDMDEFIRELDSEYILDGARQEMTPRQMLEEAVCPGSSEACRACSGEPVVDESVDPALDNTDFSGLDLHKCLEKMSEAECSVRAIPSSCPAEATLAELEFSLLDAIWKTGHFRLENLAVDISWEWDAEPVGNLSAFYRSVEAACGYLDLLGVRLSGYEFRTGDSCRMTVLVREGNGRDELMDFIQDARPVEMGNGRRCPGKLSGDRGSWLIYVPFDTCKFRLGGSLFSEMEGRTGGKVPDVRDYDYFMDCFEIVREFVEDGVAVSGTTCGRGGLMRALAGICGEDSGVTADISDVMRSYGETEKVNVLFGEVPGVLMEIRDSDFDYVDAEMLLQDVAYYPLGHPDGKGVSIVTGDAGNVSGILQSLMDSRDMAPEGED